MRIPSRIAAAAAIAAAALAPNAGADVLVDDFESGVALTTNNDRPLGSGTRWRPQPDAFSITNNFYTSTPIGNANSFRTISNTSLGTNKNFTNTFVAHNGGNAFRFDNSNGGVIASGAATDALKFQALYASLYSSTANFNASAENYIRFTAYLPTTGVQVASQPPNSIFLFAMTQEPTAFTFNAPNPPPQQSMGPWDGTGTTLTGITLTTTPTVFIIPIKDPNWFKVHPTYDSFVKANVAGTPVGGDYSIDDWTKIRIFQWGYFRSGAPAGASTLGNSTGQGRFAIDDIILSAAPPGVQYDVPSTTITEGGPGVGFQVRLAARPSHSVTLNFDNQPQYTLSPATVTFTTANWNTYQTVTATAVDDGAVEGDANFTYTPTRTSSDLWYANVANTIAGQPITVVDNDFPSVIASAPDNTTSEGGATGSLLVRLDSPPAADVTVSLSSSNPAEGAPAVPSLTFNSGNWSVDQSVTVNGVDDAVYDGDQPFNIQFATTSADATFNGLVTAPIGFTNADDEPMPSLEFTTAPGTVLAESGGSANLTVSRSPNATNTATVAYSVQVGGTATEGADFASVSGTLQFDPMVASQDIPVSALADLIDEDGESFTVVLSAPSNAVLGTAAAYAVSIADDDTAAGIVEALDDVTSEAGAGGGFGFRLATEPTAPVAVTVTSLNTGEGVVMVGGTLNFDSSNWSTPVSVSVAGQQDAVRDGDVSYTIRAEFAGADAKYAALLPIDTAFLNVDDEGPTTMAFAIAAPTFLNNDGAVALEVVLNQPDAATVAADYQFTNGSAANGTDFSGANGTLTFAPLDSSESIPVTLLPFPPPTASKDFSVALTNLNGAAISGPAAVTVTVNNASGVAEWSLLD